MTHRHRRSVWAVLGRALGAAALVTSIGGCAIGDSSAAPVSGSAVTSSAGAATPAPSPTAQPVDDTVGVVAVGDSITAGTGPDDRLQTPGAQSWVPAAEGAPLQFAGGWAVPGATTQEMRIGVTEMPAVPDADVLFVMAGTNDLYRLPWEVSADDLRAIAETVAADDVVVSAIPPFDAAPQDAATFNDRLRTLAADQGWDFVDPWTEVSVDGSYAPGATVDGVHPTPQTADQVGQRIRQELLTHR